MFEITFERISKQLAPSGFDLGHVVVRVDGQEVSSENRTPNQACMVFVTATLWLDEVCRFLRHGRVRSVELIAADSSFRVVLVRRGGGGRGVLSLEVAGVRVGDVGARELADGMLRGARGLRDEHALGARDAAREDLDAAIVEFERGMERLQAPSSDRGATRRGIKGRR